MSALGTAELFARVLRVLLDVQKYGNCAGKKSSKYMNISIFKATTVQSIHCRIVLVSTDHLSLTSKILGLFNSELSLQSYYNCSTLEITLYVK